MKKNVIILLCIMLCMFCLEGNAKCEEIKEYPVTKIEKVLKLQRLQEENEALQVQYIQPIITVYVTDEIKISVTSIKKGTDKATKTAYHRVDYTITNKDLINGECYLAAYDANEKMLFCKTQDLSPTASTYITTLSGSSPGDISKVDHYKIMFWQGTGMKPYCGRGIITKEQIASAQN